MALTPAELLQRCLDSGDRDAWEEFVRRYRRTVALVVLRVAHIWNESSTHVIDDLVQDTFLKLCEDNCRILREFRSEQPNGFARFVKVIAANLAQDHFRAVHTTKRGDGLVCTQEPPESAITLWVPAAERAIVFKEINEFLENACGVRQKDKAVFWMYYRDGMTAKAIASIPGFELSTKGVESIIFRLTQQVRARFQNGPSHAAKRGIH